MLAVKEITKTVTLEVSQENKIGQTLWILLDNNKSKIRIGVIYAPHEDVTSNNGLKIMYNNLSKHISIAQEERQQVPILGHFSAKIHTYIVQGQERSKLDYIQTNSKLLSAVTEMIADENKQYIACKLEKSRKKYLDHNEILSKLNLVTAIEKQKKNRIITKCGYKKYRKKLTQKQISGILKQETIQVSYDKWSEEVENNITEVEKICRQNPRKDIMQLKRQRKKLRAQYQNTENIYEKTLIIERIKLITGTYNR